MNLEKFWRAVFWGHDITEIRIVKQDSGYSVVFRQDDVWKHFYATRDNFLDSLRATLDDEIVP